MKQSGPFAEEAFRQVLAHRTMLKAYIMAIVRDPLLAEETLSDVSFEIARCWDRYDPARPFAWWARGVARRVALANLRKARRPFVILDAQVLESIGLELDRMGNEAELEQKKQVLTVCVQKLSVANQALIQMRYFENRSYDDISRLLGRTIGALYVAFNRIHAALFRCMKRQLKET